MTHCVCCYNNYPTLGPHIVERKSLYCPECTRVDNRCLGIDQYTLDDGKILYSRCSSFTNHYGCYYHQYINHMDIQFIAQALVEKLGFLPHDLDDSICAGCGVSTYYQIDKKRKYFCVNCRSMLNINKWNNQYYKLIQLYKDAMYKSLQSLKNDIATVDKINANYKRICQRRRLTTASNPTRKTNVTRPRRKQFKLVRSDGTASTRLTLD